MHMSTCTSSLSKNTNTYYQKKMYGQVGMKKMCLASGLGQRNDADEFSFDICQGISVTRRSVYLVELLTILLSASDRY